MKKLNSQLFKKFQLNKTDKTSIVGGQYTSANTDTNMSNGSNDYAIDTDIGNGETMLDVANTNPAGGTRDKPVLTYV